MAAIRKPGKSGQEPVMVPVAITAKVDGFRRAGRGHSAKRTIWPPGTFTEQQLAQLKAEPMLVVEVLPAEEQTDGKIGQNDPKDKEKDDKAQG